MPDDQTAALLRARFSLDPRYVGALKRIESGGDPYAVTGSNRGQGQFGPEEERLYGITNANRADPAMQTAAIEREANAHAVRLRNSLGRDPTPSELYFSHQQGVAGGPALLSADAGTPAWKVVRPYYKNDAIAQQAVMGNIPTGNPLRSLSPDQVTAGDFRNLWMDRFNREMAKPGSSGGVPATAFAGPTAIDPSQPAAVPVAPQNEAAPNDALLGMLQKLSSPQPQQQPAPPPMQLAPPRAPPGLDIATAIARAQGRERIA